VRRCVGARRVGGGKGLVGGDAAVQNPSGGCKDGAHLRAGGLTAQAKEVGGTLEGAFPRIVEKASRSVTDVMYAFLFAYLRADESGRQAAKDARLVPALIFQIERFESGAIKFGKAKKVKSRFCSL
jgi:hypothetical protein